MSAAGVAAPSMRILVASFFPATYPPRSGGEQRLYYLYLHLSRYFDITLLAPNWSHLPTEVVTHGPSFREHRVPKDEVYDRLHWKLDAEHIGPECSAYVVSLAAGNETGYGRRFEALVGEHDLIIHESPFTLPYDRTLGDDGKPRIANTHNVESRLAAQMLQGDAGRKGVAFIRFLEETLIAVSSLVLATSEEERLTFVREFGVDPRRTALAPNGFEPSEVAAGPAASARAAQPYTVFMGSAHPPNVEAARYIVDRVAPALPHVEFRLLGAVCDKLPATLPRNVTPLGFVDDAEKRRQLAGAAAALNPLFAGAGTNLKMLDYMAAGLAIVSTGVGARGLDLTDGVDVVLAERDDYVDRLRAVVDAPVTAAHVGAAAKQKAFTQYTWAQIADRVRDAIQTIVLDRPLSGGRPLLLVVNDFSVAARTNGGQVRIHELLTELGREFDVVLLCLTGEAHRKDRLLAEGFREVCIPKTAEHRDADARARHEATVWIDDLVAAEFCTRNPEYVGAFVRLAARAVAVVFEHPYLAPMLDLLPPGARVVYSSLNVERDLKAETLRPRRDATAEIARVAALEDRLLARADLVVCVSDADRDRFRTTHPDRRYAVIVSGARVGGPPAPWANGHGQDGDPLHGRPLAVFVGSGHPPNVTAARFLAEVVAPAVPEVTFALIGSVCDAFTGDDVPANVLRFGVLTEAEKTVLLARAAIAVNPLFEGGGSSLKVPDFFAAGLPVVSTSVGMRGFDVGDGEHYLAADRDDFVEKTRMLARDAGLRQRLAAGARALSEQTLDWRVLGARYRRLLRSLVAPDTRRRVLVATYRFADPPPGGAEAFLVHVLRALARRGNLEIDVATCDVGTITNRWHFSASYAPPRAPALDPTYVRAVHRFAVDPSRLTDFAHCARLFSAWMAETREQARALLAHFVAPLLLGGWNYPERYGNAVARWTSHEAQVLVPPATSAVRLVGAPPQPTVVEMLRGGVAIAARTVTERFEWEVPLGGDDPVVTIRVPKAFAARDDPRELGVMVLALSICVDGRWTAVDLERDFELVGRREIPDAWVRSLVDVASRRDRTVDDLFVPVRGPRSTEFREWLTDQAASYDVVLAQGIPFSTPVDVIEIAGRQGVPVVILPHFHMEDRYYHWRSYYDAFRAARCVIASSPELKALVFDAIGATSVALPGGGVDLDEYAPADLPARRAAFRALHASDVPFVLVLGRKAASKNYRMVVDAVAALNASRLRLDLVIIGPEEDGLPLSAPHTHYYGSQDRDVVLGALSLAVCLANMSESESFGIVLVESWLSGRPVVAQRRCMAFTDLVVPGENGLLADSVAELARAIETYLDDPALAARHGERGRALAETFSWAHLAERIETILADATVEARPTARDYHVR